MTETLLAEPTAAPPTAAPASPTPGTTPTAPAAPVSPAPPAPSDWRATLPDELKAHQGLGKFKDVAALAKGYVEIEKYRGESVRIPGPEAKPEERTAFYRKLGMPESPDGYAVAAPEGMPAFDPGLTKDFQATAHKLNLTQEQVTGLVGWFAGGPVGNPQLATEGLRTEAVKSLRDTWGGAFDYNLSVAQGALQFADRQTGGNLRAVLESTGLGNHPEVVKHFHWLGKQFAEDGEILTDARTDGLVGPAEAKAKIAAIRADKDHPFHKGDKDARAEMLRLYEIASAAG